MQRYKKIGNGLVLDNRTKEELDILGVTSYLQLDNTDPAYEITPKLSARERKANLKNYAEKIGAEIDRFHHITDNGNDFLFAEVCLDGMERADWHFPLVTGRKGMQEYDETDTNAVPF